MDARLQRQPSVPPKSHRGDPPAGPERKGQPRDDVRRVAHEAAAQRQRAARAEDHNIAEETNGDEATMDERDNDKESGDGVGRDENERRRHRRRLEEAFGIGDDPTRGRREGNEVAPTTTRGAMPDGLDLPQEAPPRNREERIRLAKTEESREGADARDVNILIWTSRKSVGHEKNDRVMVHGDDTRADGRRSRI